MAVWGAVGGRPRIPRQQCCNHGIDRTAIGGNRCVDLRCGGNPGQRRNAHAFTLPFIGGKPEGLVLDEGSACGESVLVVVEKVLLLVGGIKEITRVQPIVAEILIDGTTDRIGPGFGYHIHGCAGAAPKFSFSAGGYRNLLQGIKRQNGCRYPEHPLLIDGGEISVSIIHVSAVE